ncbi:hypothetical protein M430DRAFT_254331 [Amorphotheca resinae ATCC 22711]|jgi:hypothetical protein|uniref:Uncharacterized protein n=1 Tax=Amorphotheca resinae ATCC 22711 TaxID=857342 RepID=A0A2T3AXZ0_AMORE|nr:hypothetical protein M430DRAFT_254331 [Amorphotheca resinae ATCC 22711]PSS14910.1 hypothetical protein M430DRAFT_254331 [Amorphotheca resinae ATCC 22711]
MNNKLVVFFYVDDTAMLSRHSDYDKYLSFRNKLFNKYETRYGHLRCFFFRYAVYKGLILNNIENTAHSDYPVNSRRILLPED